MALKIDTYSTADGSIQAPKQVPDTLEKFLNNAADVPSNTKGLSAVTFMVPTGATGTTETWKAPFACTIIGATGFKTGAANTDAGDKIEVKTADGTAILDFAVNVANEQSIAPLVDDSVIAVTKDDVLSVVRTKTALGDVSAVISMLIVPQ